MYGVGQEQVFSILSQLELLHSPKINYTMKKKLPSLHFIYFLKILGEALKST